MLIFIFILLCYCFVGCNSVATCPNGWTFWYGNCYQVFENLNWFDAENRCKTEKAHLVSIHSHDENLFVANLTNYPGADVCLGRPQAWIGLYTDDANKSWKWTDGTPTDYLYWYPSDPLFPGKHNCIYMHAAPICSGKIGMFANGDAPCDAVFNKFVCKKVAVEVETALALNSVPKMATIISEPNYCLEGWKFWNGNCYKVFDNSNWHNAENRCKVHHAHLASIHSEEEQLFVADLGSYPGAHDCVAKIQGWIGLYTDDGTKTWKWTDGTPADYLPWYPGNPYPMNNLCGYIHLAPICSGKLGLIANGGAPCTTVYNKFICKKGPEKVNNEMAKIVVPKTISLISEPKNCEESWSFWNGNCYKVFGNANWQNAEDECKQNGAHLVSIHSKEENLYVAYLTSHPGADVCSSTPQGWIGLYTEDPSMKEWKWTDGTPTDYLNWFPDNPSKPGLHNCIYLHLAPICSGKIGMFANGDAPCTKILQKFTCKKEAAQNNNNNNERRISAVPKTISLNPKTNDCWEGWTFWNGNCYRVFDNSNWHNAENRCQIYHGHLASIHSAEENNFLADLASYPGAHQCVAKLQGWIGLYTDDANKSWKWTDGSPTDYLYWFPQNPSRPGVHNCAYLHLAPICNGRLGLIANGGAPCTEVLNKYICKTGKQKVKFDDEVAEIAVPKMDKPVPEPKMDEPVRKTCSV